MCASMHCGYICPTLRYMRYSRLNVGDLYFDATIPRAVQLTRTRVEFVDRWQLVMDMAWARV